VLFAFYFNSFRKELAVREEQEQVAKAEAERKAAVEREEYQKKVAEEARKAAEERNRIELEKRAAARAEEDRFEALQQQYEAAVNKRDELTEKFYELSTIQRDEQDLLRRAEQRQARLTDEKTFLERYLPAAIASREKMTNFLSEIEAAEKAAAEAAQANNRRR
jgi:translation initiation factor IF-2